ncbi:MAG: PLDc N-terminal domain-containing protein [Lachnospiraceae bacterium]
MQADVSQLTEFLPFLIPLIIAEFALLGYTLWHILSHKSYKRGNRTLWLVVTIIGMNYIGPILYFILGKEDA